jgi:hypothetical protein
MSNITWDQAEQYFPGCSAEWDEMCLIGGDYCPKDPNITISRIEILNNLLHVICEDKEDVPHRMRRTWIRHSDKYWTHPTPWPIAWDIILKLCGELKNNV